MSDKSIIDSLNLKENVNLKEEKKENESKINENNINNKNKINDSDLSISEIVERIVKGEKLRNDLINIFEGVDSSMLTFLNNYIKEDFNKFYNFYRMTDEDENGNIYSPYENSQGTYLRIIPPDTVDDNLPKFMQTSDGDYVKCTDDTTYYTTSELEKLDIGLRKFLIDPHFESYTKSEDIKKTEDIDIINLLNKIAKDSSEFRKDPDFPTFCFKFDIVNRLFSNDTEHSLKKFVEKKIYEFVENAGFKDVDQKKISITMESLHKAFYIRILNLFIEALNFSKEKKDLSYVELFKALKQKIARKYKDIFNNKEDEEEDEVEDEDVDLSKKFFKEFNRITRTKHKNGALLDEFINIASDIVYLSFIQHIDKDVKYCRKVSENEKCDGKLIMKKVLALNAIFQNEKPAESKEKKENN